MRLEPLRDFTEVAPSEVVEFVSARTPREAQAVFIGGNPVTRCEDSREPRLREAERRMQAGSNELSFYGSSSATLTVS